MSGIVGIVNLDGAPVDGDLLCRMTRALDFRGPDACRTWIDGATGFGHTLLRTTDESEHEVQPVTLDGSTWIVADARVDAREELVAALNGRGRSVAPDRPDAELILHAYQTWGDTCVQHLMGDFAFAIWDARRRMLFCARDQMGVRPFFYAHVGSSVIFSNTLDCVRMHPSVTDRLNDLAVADFLMFGVNKESDTSIYEDIRRLAAAHVATWIGGRLHLRCYWTLPIDEPLYLRRNEDYVDRFRELLNLSVSDRLRTSRVGIFMSGGVDSSTLAATACDRLRTRSDPTAVCAFTTSYEGFDEERYYAGLVAEKLGIRIEFRGWSDAMADPDWQATTFHTPEPHAHANSFASDVDSYRKIATFGRVAHEGEGPDNALHYEWKPYVCYLVTRRRFGRLARDVSVHSFLHRRVPWLPTLVREMRYGREVRPEPSFPEWFNADLERRFALRDRWKRFAVSAEAEHPVRPKGYASFRGLLWHTHFEQFDCANTGAVLEVRHPFVDLRLLRFLLAVPPIPWCRNKYLVRRAMRGALPPPVLRRPKTPLYRDPWTERVLQQGLGPLAPSTRLDVYMDSRKVPRVGTRDARSFWVHFRTRTLSYWLRNLPGGVDNCGIRSLQSGDELRIRKTGS